MRVHRLEVTAFGPFAATETLDFDVLNDAGIFLLTGQTGAGKTSVLDAISFALFGAVPGARNRAKTFKSQHADPEVRPVVTLEVTIRERRLRIRRSPGWRRPSRRARDGFVDEQPRVTVEELVGGGWQARASRLDEAGLLVRSLLGMTQEQFCQVVMLPQGQFETFLRAEAKDRHDLLEALFETSRFQRVESWLAEVRRRRESEWADVRRRIDDVLARALEVAGLAATAADGEWSRDHEAALPRLRSRRDELEVAVTTADEHAALTLADAKAAQHALDEATGLAERQERHRAAQRRLDELTALQPAVDARITQVERARAAAGLAHLVDLVDESEQLSVAAAEALEGALRTSGELLDRLVPAAPDQSAPPDALGSAGRIDAALTTARDLRARLAHLAEVESEAERLRRRIEADDTALHDAEVTLAALQEHADQLPGELADLGERLREAEVAARARDSAAELLDRARSRHAAAEDAARLRPEVEQAQRAHLDARERSLDARDEVHRLRAARLAGYAAELAGALRAEQPCPVCGGTEHPAPAERAGGHVSADDERAADAALDDAEAAAEAAATRLAALRSALAVAEAAAGEDTPEATAEGVALAELTLEHAAAAAAEVDRLSRRLTELTERRDDVDRGLQQAQTEHASLVSRRAADLEQLARADRRLEPALDGHATLGSRLAALDADLAVLASLRAAGEERQRCQAEVAAHRARLDAELARSPFDDGAGVVSALLPRSEVATLDALNRSHAAELVAVERELRDPALAAAMAAEAPDLEGLRARAALAADARAEAHALAVALTRQGERLTELVAELEATVDAAEPVRAARDLADRVAGMCAGTAKDNRHKTRLSHYVVAARLEQVVDAANVRLRTIGSGRYQLEHSLTRSAGSSRGGLSLIVLDTYTDLRRDPATLSGGETFYVSLALALGLADLVSGEAGGAELSTLFVDEGFGALDAETLDEVMDEIDALRAGGRSVGLVSHLAELRMRVPTQVPIERSRHGSRIGSPR